MTIGKPFGRNRERERHTNTDEKLNAQLNTKTSLRSVNQTLLLDLEKLFEIYDLPI